MKQIFILTLLAAAASIYAVPPPGIGGPNFLEQNQNLVVNNRVFLKVNGKPITVMDVVRKMDLIFYRQFPELAGNDAARYQFFSTGWEAMLEALIDDHLIMADAEEKKVVISDGEVREELETLFGPDVVLNLDKLGLSLAEATDLLRTELTVQRMNMIMVRAKAITEVHPKRVRQRYEELIQLNPPQNQFVYQVLSIRGEKHKEVAKEAAHLLNEQKLPFEEVLASLTKHDVELSLSDDYERDEGELSLAHKAVLQTLSVGAHSAPLSKESVSRIFVLKEFKDGAPTPFNEMAGQLKSEITQEVAVELNEAYRLKLRDHYGLTAQYFKQAIPEQFQPFALR